jgi:hypothetical protein
VDQNETLVKDKIDRDLADAGWETDGSFSEHLGLAASKPLCRLLQHHTLYARVLGKLHCPLPNAWALDEANRSSAHLWARDDLEGTPSYQRTGNDLPGNHHLPTRLPHI